LFVSVPKVSIDGESHGDLLLIAIGSGASFAVIILFVLTSLIRHKKDPEKSKKSKKNASSQVKHIGDFTLAPSPSDSAISSASSQKSNLMFKYFGKSLSSFDLEKAEKIATTEPAEERNPPGCFVIRIDSSDERQVYRQNILTVGEVKSIQGVDEKTQTFRYIQTIAC
jgi:hypothetical protein